MNPLGDPGAASRPRGCPEAVRKHDGRVVAYDGGKLAGSIARAACTADASLQSEGARRLANELTQALGAILVNELRSIPASADIRAVTIKLLRDTNYDGIAAAYAEHARNTSSLLWRVRVVDPGTPFTSPAGSPWDRRRLLESLRASGIARDPAGEAAREVERRVVVLAQERISPALIHALAVLVLAQRALEIKPYGARRIAFSLATHVPFYDAASAERSPLPKQGPALEALWLQAIHSVDVVRGVRDNVLSLEPYPASPSDSDDENAPGFSPLADPLLPEMGQALRRWLTDRQTFRARTLWVRADGPERAGELARFVSLLPESLTPDRSSGAILNVLLKTQPAGKPTSKAVNQRTTPLTINIAGLIMREALRDPHRATVRLAKAVALASQAHREREEYFNLCPVRGRSLPIAIAGLWNATAWLQGESLDAPRATRGSRALAGTLVAVLQGAIETMRHETGMELCLAGTAPVAAVQRLWSRDREFFIRDGINLDPNAMYDGGPAVTLIPGAEDFGERLEFAKAMGSAFDEPPALAIEVPLGTEPDLPLWRDFFAVFALAGMPRLQLLPGGNSRAMKNLVRAVRAHLEGFPLFEQTRSNG